MLSSWLKYWHASSSISWSYVIRVLEWRLFSFNLEVKNSAYILERARSSTKSLSSDWCKSCGERGAFANFRNIQEVRIWYFMFGFLGKTICRIDTEITVVHMASGLTQGHWNSKVHCFHSFNALTKSFNTSFANSVWCPSFSCLDYPIQICWVRWSCSFVLL